MNKKIIKKYLFIIVILINLFIYGTCETPTSRAKYYKESATSEKIKYETNISRLNYAGDTTLVDFALDAANSTPYEARFDATFKRNNIMYTDNTTTAGTADDKSDIDTYYFTLTNAQNKCSIVSVSTDDAIQSDIPVRTDTTATINYYENAEDTVHVRVKCDVNGISDNYDYIARGFRVDERIRHNDASEEELFNYVSYSDNTLTLTNYYDIVGYPAATSYYDAAMSTLRTKYAGNTTEEKAGLEAYFNSVYKYNDGGVMKKLSDASFTTVSLDGFTYNLGTSTYNFDDKFLGYALTYYICTNRASSDPYHFVYSQADTDANIISLFGTYIDKYGSTTLKANKTTIIDYITDTGISTILNNGVSFIASTYPDGYPYHLIFNDNIVSEIKNQTAVNVFEIGNGVDPDDMYWSYNEKVRQYITFDNALLRMAINRNIFDYDDIDDYPDFIKSAVKNNAEVAVKETFSDMYLLPNDGTGSATSVVMFNFYSTGGSTNYLGMYKIATGENVTLAVPDGTSISNAYTMINRINNEVLHPETPINITDLGPGESTGYDDEGIEHFRHIQAGITFDVYTKAGIKYISYTLS